MSDDRITKVTPQWLCEIDGDQIYIHDGPEPQIGDRVVIEGNAWRVDRDSARRQAERRRAIIVADALQTLADIFVTAPQNQWPEVMRLVAKDLERDYS